MLTKKQFLLGISLAFISKVVIIAPASARDDFIGIQLFNAPPNFSSSGNISIPAGMSSSGSFSGSSSISSGSAGGSSGSSSISSGSTGGSSGSSSISSGSAGDSSGSSGISSGSVGDSSGSSGDVNTANASGTGDSSSGSSSDGATANAGDDSNTATASNNSETITVADIADYFTSSIDQSLQELDTSTIAQQPRRIVRRRSSGSCPNPQISGSSARLNDLLSQSEKFLEEVNQVKPENSPW